MALPIFLAILADFARNLETFPGRDHVRLRPEWGAADSGAKFDTEVTLPDGKTTFS